jgi:hypothetical protein
MIALLTYLIRIRFRKLFGKEDYLAISLLLTGIAVLLYFTNKNYSHYANFSLLFLIEIARIHSDRKDIELLKLSSHFNTILFLEYSVYSLPIIVLLLINQKFIAVVFLFLFLFLISRIPKINQKPLRYPFKMFDPFWVVSFRKSKLVLFFPFIFLFGYMGFKYNNENLYYAVLVFFAVIACIPSFEREELIHIKASFYIGKNYLFQQFKAICYNFIYLGILLVILFAVLQQWFLIVFIPIVLFFPMLNLLFKYAFFERKIVHSIFFTLFLGNLIYGFPLLLIPFLYFKAIKNLNKIQNA